MKSLLILLTLLVITSTTKAQRAEFKLYDNGLIYSARTMGKLSEIADSLNQHFQRCDLDKKYYSIPQGKGNRVKLSGEAVTAAVSDIESNISFEQFVEKYPDAEIKREVLIISYNYINWKDEAVYKYSEVGLDDNGVSVSMDDEAASNWAYDSNDYSDLSLTALYFEELNPLELNDSYAKIIGYAECMIDTNGTKMKENLKEGTVDMPKNWKQLSPRKQAALLDELRSARVVGFCSQDNRPRQHAINIAMLSAETANWEVFLRAHLDIMNDRFDRAVDGSYAWDARQTYVRELEELNINVIDLILGISLRINNPSENHYFGSISRVGRALSETSDRDRVQNALASVIMDSQLDDYNRILAYYIFSNYLYWMEDEAGKTSGKKILDEAVAALPDYLKRDASSE